MRGPRRALSVAALAAALLGVAAPARADAALKGMWSANTLNDGQPVFPALRDLGVDVMQYQLRWDLVARSRPADPRNPADPAYRWPRPVEEAVAASATYGFRVALMVKGTPRWANGGRANPWAPDDPGDYADFVVAAARRYPSVRHWMIWGEANRGVNFQPLPLNSPRGPRAYAILLDRAYGVLKAERRSNVVIGGMSWAGADMYPSQWVKAMRLPDRRPPRLDWYGHNPYGRYYPRLSGEPDPPEFRDFSGLDTFVREVRRHWAPRRIRPRLWLSEYTVCTDRPSWAFDFWVTRDAQARWLRAAYRIADRHGWIAGLGWWKLQDEPQANEPTCGLLDVAGAPKPAFYAYKSAG